MNDKARPVLVFGILGILSACGGGGGGGSVDPTVPEPDFTYRQLTPSRSTSSDGATTSDLRMIGVRLPASNGLPSGTYLAEGSRNGATDGISVSSVVSDPSGRDAVERWRGGSVVVSPVDPSSTVFDGQYDFVIPIQIDGSSIAAQEVAVLGVPTRGADLPATGTVVYSGQGEVTRKTAGSSGTFNGSASTDNMSIVADFRANQVRMTMNDLETEPGSQSVGFDTLSIHNMALSRQSATFTGGALTLSGSSRSPTGDSSQLSARGSFYGDQRDTAPAGAAEAAGAFVQRGSDGAIYGTFIADTRN